MPDFEQSSEHVAGLQPHHEPLGPQLLLSASHSLHLCYQQGTQELTEISLAVTQHRAGPWFEGPAILVMNPWSGGFSQVLVVRYCPQLALALRVHSSQEEMSSGHLGWTGMSEVELRLCLTCLCCIKWEVWANSAHGHFLSRQPRAQARAMSQKHACM